MPINGPKRLAWEPLLFWALVVVHLLPVFAAHWFVTLDGPCHLYSARIVKDLLLGDAFMGGFFHLSSFPEPYWTGHAIMALGLLVFPAWVVEKVIFSLAIVGLAWAFRYFIRTIAPQRSWIALLVMPFLLHYALRLGFLNFSLSLPLYFIALALVWRGTENGRMQTGWLAVVLALLYFTHLFTFVLGVATIMALLTWTSILKWRTDRAAARTMFVGFAKAALLPVLLTVAYLATHNTLEVVSVHASFGDLLKWASEGRAWNGLGNEGEQLLCMLTAVPLFLAGIAALIVRAIALRKGTVSSIDFWPLLAVAGLVGYFILPDAMAGGTSASPRMLLFAMFFLAAWLAVAPLPKWSLVIVVTAVVLVDLAHTRIQYRSSAHLGKELAEYLGVANALEDGTVLLPINHSNNWMHSNFSNYLGTGAERVVVLDHFTALAPFNPEQWNTGRLPHEAIGNFSTSNSPCVRLAGYKEKTGADVDLVLRWKANAIEPDSCATDLTRQLEQDYVLAASSENGDAQLFKKR